MPSLAKAARSMRLQLFAGPLSHFIITSSITFLAAFTFAQVPTAFAHGFNANRVQIMRLLNGTYRVVIQYTHVEVGEYREAHVDFEKKDEAIKAYQDLVQGADFFLGDMKKTIHFHTPPQKNKPF